MRFECEGAAVRSGKAQFRWTDGVARTAVDEQIGAWGWAGGWRREHGTGWESGDLFVQGSQGAATVSPSRGPLQLGNE